MIIEHLRIENFRCFGPEPITLSLTDDVTALIGGNGAGKTAALVALSRLFGISRYQRTVLKSDFHRSVEDTELESETTLIIEALFAFPELETENEEETEAVPEFWRQMAATEEGEALKVRLQLQATWVDDGTPEGTVDEDVRWILRMDDEFNWEECPKVAPADRSAVQMIYVPAARNADEQVKTLLRGRLWRAAAWSDVLGETVTTNTEEIQTQFAKEEPVRFISKRLQKRWSQVHSADTDAEPVLRLVEGRFEALVRQAEIRFRPDEAGLERELDRLSDGQKSLFQIALTAATLEVERSAAALPAENSPFDPAKLRRVPLTLLAIEEPENSLSPFFLSRIMALAEEIGGMPSAQVLLASHSASILSRIPPESIRYFRQDETTRDSTVRELTLPSSKKAAAYVRLAVRAYPELYFARFVVLAEGDSEQVVLPRIAEAQGVILDRSFVPIVPLGGRHVTHFWRLLTDLDIPFATLLDLDLGRQHGGASRIKTIVENLAEIGEDMEETLAFLSGDINPADLSEITDEEFALLEPEEEEEPLRGDAWITALREKGVFFSHPLDLDFSLLMYFPKAYQIISSGGTGPRTTPEALSRHKRTALGKGGNVDLYPAEYDDDFTWYPYLFLRRSKPDTHLAALARLDERTLRDKGPEEFDALISHIKSQLGL